jgi:hypothetical protein
MNDILQKIPGESLRDPWQLEAPMLPSEYGERADERFLSDLEGPFLVGGSNEIERDVQAEGQAPETGALTEAPEQSAEAWEDQEHLPEEVPPAIFESTAEFDPYAAIRPVLSPEHAALTADEITAVLGLRPAILALHGLLSQPELPRALLAILLGKTGRRSVFINGADIPIAAYLRQLSRLCREAADYHETELGAEMGELPTFRRRPRASPSASAIAWAAPGSPTGAGGTPAVAAFPGAFADPLDDGTTAASQKLRNALAAARAAAGTPDALKTLPIVIVSFDPAGPPYPHAETKATEEDFSASLLKVAALYSAFQLRVTANAVAGAMQKVPADKVFQELSAALDKTIDAAVPLITGEKKVTAAMRVPRYQDIFDAAPIAAGGFTLSFKPFFSNALSDMIVHGNNQATGFVIHSLGYSYINGLLQSAGFFRNATAQSGIWLAGDFLLASLDPSTKKIVGRYKDKVIEKWPYVRIDSVNDKKVAQATTCIDMARLFVLLHDKKLVTDPSPLDGNQEMLDLLAGAVAHNQFWLTHKPPGWKANDFIAGLSYTNTHSKIGVEKLKTGKPVWSEGVILRHTTSGREFVVIWQDLRDGNLVTGLSRIVDRTIISFLTP